MSLSPRCYLIMDYGYGYYYSVVAPVQTVPAITALPIRSLDRGEVPPYHRPTAPLMSCSPITMKPCIQFINPTDKHTGDSKKRKHTIKIEMKIPIEIALPIKVTTRERDNTGGKPTRHVSARIANRDL